MLAALIVVSVFCLLFFSLWIYTLRLALRASRLNQHYEQFYESTLEDIESILEYHERLYNGRSVVLDDPEVQRLFKTIEISHKILSGYMNANTQEKEENKEENKGN